MVRRGIELLKKQLAESDLKASVLSDQLGAYQFFNSEQKARRIEFAHSRMLIHFLFSLSGEIQVTTKASDEKVTVSSTNFFMFSYPIEETSLVLHLPPEAKVFSLIISMKELHSVFGSSFGRDNAETKSFIESYKLKKFFVEKPVTPAITVVIHQFFSGIIRENVLPIYQKGKVMEFLSLYMDSPNSVEEVESQCPFLMDAREMKKITEARDVIIENMMNPPSLKYLAKQVGTNEYKLKVGFKSVFSNTVYGYLADHRMEEARKLLTVDNSRIKEVAAQVGYSNSSHFIAAYKRKYGVTPKQHRKSLIT